MSEIYLFPGEAVVRRGMGADLFPMYRDMADMAGQILGYDLAELCIQDPHKKLARPHYAGPAAFVVNAMTYRSKVRTDFPADVVAGHGAGEYNALLAAGAIDFVSGLQMVAKRAELLGEARGGAMVRVFGIDAEHIQNVLDGQGFQQVYIADYFAPKQVVIAGPEEHMDSAVAWMEQAGAKRTVRLPGTGAFYTPLMADIAREFGEFLLNFCVHPARLPVISNWSARAHAGDTVFECLTRQLCCPIQWEESIRYLKTFPKPNFSEVGHGKTLSIVLRSITPRQPAATS